MSEKTASENKVSVHKKWWFWVIIIFVFIGIIGAVNQTSIDEQDKQTDVTISQMESEDIEEKDEMSGPEEENKITDPKTKIKSVVMTDTISKWDDVDEVSLSINDNLGEAYNGTYIIIISANYSGNSNKLSDTLTTYCNKVATALDSSEESIAEMMISWKKGGSTTVGKCHYHNKDGLLMYDDDSMGILKNK